jgi:hypothetical protein
MDGVLSAIYEASWNKKDYAAANTLLPTPLKNLPCFLGKMEALENLLCKFRTGARQRKAPKPPGPNNLPPAGFSTTAPIPAPGMPAAIFNGKHWNTGVYIDSLPSRRVKGSANEMHRVRRLVVVVRPAAKTARSKKLASAGKKKRADAVANTKRADAVVLKLVVCDVSCGFAGATPASPA